MMTQMSSGIAAKSLFQRPCGRWDAFTENTKHKNHGKKTENIRMLLFFFSNVEHLPLSLFLFFYTLCISSFLPKDFVSFFFKASRLQINPPVAALNRTNVFT